MEIFEAIKNRKSVRAFKPEPVSTETLKELLERSMRAPSGVNKQPWEFYLVKGKTLDKLRNVCVEQFRQGVLPRPNLPLPDKDKGGTGLLGEYRTRQVRLAVQIFELLRIAKGDQKAMDDYAESMYRFFDAPAAILIVMDKQLHPTWPIVDMGTISQTIALAALEYGLGTCIMRALVDYPEKVREVVGIPESKLVIVGLIIGYPDWDHPINRLESERESLDDLLTIVE